MFDWPEIKPKPTRRSNEAIHVRGVKNNHPTTKMSKNAYNQDIKRIFLTSLPNGDAINQTRHQVCFTVCCVLWVRMYYTNGTSSLMIINTIHPLDESVCETMCKHHHFIFCILKMIALPSNANKSMESFSSVLVLFLGISFFFSFIFFFHCFSPSVHRFWVLFDLSRPHRNSKCSFVTRWINYTQSPDESERTQFYSVLCLPALCM